MPRLLLNDEWYEPLRPNTTPDNEYELLVKRAGGRLFPEFRMVTVRQRIAGADHDVLPHLVLYDENYRSWWLTVLETGRPPKPERLMRDAQILRDHYYDQEFARVAAERDSELDLPRFAQLIKNEAPRVLFLLAHPPAPELDRDDVRVGIVEIFQDSHRNKILRINGQRPEVVEDFLGTCTRDLFLTPQLLQITGGGVGNIAIGPHQIEMDAISCTWTVYRDDDGSTWLMPPNGTALPTGVSVFSLTRTAAGRLRLTPQG